MHPSVFILGTCRHNSRHRNQQRRDPNTAHDQRRQHPTVGPPTLTTTSTNEAPQLMDQRSLPSVHNSPSIPHAKTRAS